MFGLADGQEDEEEEAADKPVTTDMEVIEQSASQRAIQNLLKVYYEPLELWFLRMSIEKVSRSSLSLTQGAPTRLSGTLFAPPLVFDPGRHFLPAQTHPQPCPFLGLAANVTVDAGKDITGDGTRLYRCDSEEDGGGVCWWGEWGGEKRKGQEGEGATVEFHCGSLTEGGLIRRFT
jgi:hypothetical protein